MHCLLYWTVKKWQIQMHYVVTVLYCTVLQAVPLLCAGGGCPGSLTPEIRALLAPLESQGLVTVTPFAEILQYEVWAEGQVRSGHARSIAGAAMQVKWNMGTRGCTRGCELHHAGVFLFVSFSFSCPWCAPGVPLVHAVRVDARLPVPHAGDCRVGRLPRLRRVPGGPSPLTLPSLLAQNKGKAFLTHGCYNYNVDQCEGTLRGGRGMGGTRWR